jgi:Mg2+ and Co2+ transporter CorA
MISKYNHKELNWIDLESPSKEEIEHALDLYPIPNTIKEKIIIDNREDCVDINYDYTYISVPGKLVFFVTDNFFLSIHNEKMEAFSDFSNEIELDVVGGEKINSHKLLLACLIKNIHINNHKELISRVNEIQNLKEQLNKNKRKIKKQVIIIISLIILLIIFIWL